MTSAPLPARPEVLAFLADARDNDSDDVRLILADWLDDHGDGERAELLRVQCALAGLPEDEPRRAELQARSAALEERQRQTWLTPLLRAGAARVAFRRGLIQLQCSALWLLRTDLQALAESEVWAWVDSLIPTRAKRLHGGLRFLADLPLLAGITALDLGRNHHLNGQDVAPLFLSPRLAGLRSLRLARNPIGATGAQALFAARYLHRLRRLDLERCDLPADSLGALAQAPFRHELAALNVGGCEVSAPVLREVAADRVLPALTDLSLAASRVQAEGLAVLGDAPLSGQLRRVNLRFNGFGDAGAQVLAERWRHARPTVLELAHNRITWPGLAALAGSPVLTEVRELTLTSNRIDDAGAEALAASPFLSRLERLDLTYTGLGERGVRALARAPGLANLRRLDLGNNAVGTAAVRALLASPHLSPRLHLVLSSVNPVQVAGLRERFAGLTLG